MMEQDWKQTSNGMQVSQVQHPLNAKQRVFIALLLFMGLLLSFVVLRFLDPVTVLTNHSSSEVQSMVGTAVVLG
jgi:hypothetical protein